MKKAISLFLVAAAILSLNGFTAAESPKNDTEVKAAYIETIDETGSNIGSEETNPDVILPSSQFSVSYSLESSQLSVFGDVKGISFSVSGDLITTSENRCILLYDGMDQSANYNVAYMSLERELDKTSLFFSLFHKNHPEYINVIKVYMQLDGTNSLLLIEIYLKEDIGASLLNSQSVVYSSEAANKLQNWFVNYYSPISNSDSGISTLNAHRKDPITVTATYSMLDTQVTFVFTFQLCYDFDDIVINGGSQANIYFNILESHTECEVEGYASSTQDHFKLRDLSVSLYTAPYLMLDAQAPLRQYVRDERFFSRFDTNFSVSFTFTYRSFSLGVNFTEQKTMTGNSDVWVGLGTEQVDSSVPCETSSGNLPNGYTLYDKGAQYGIVVKYSDRSNESDPVLDPRSVLLTAHFHFILENAPEEFGSASQTLSRFVYVNVGK